MGKFKSFPVANSRVSLRQLLECSQGNANNIDKNNIENNNIDNNQVMSSGNLNGSNNLYNNQVAGTWSTPFISS